LEIGLLSFGWLADEIVNAIGSVSLWTNVVLLFWDGLHVFYLIMIGRHNSREYEVRFSPNGSDGFLKKEEKRRKRLHNTIQTQYDMSSSPKHFSTLTNSMN
jgi:hypothetical protein